MVLCGWNNNKSTLLTALHFIRVHPHHNSYIYSSRTALIKEHSLFIIHKINRIYYQNYYNEVFKRKKENK